MIVVWHQAIGMYFQVVADACFCKLIDKLVAIIVGKVDLLAMISSGCNVIKRTFKFDTKRPGHDVVRYIDSVG
jgi:hypothetical protein